ncbi:MAG: GSU2403 family nucleotidyltransferase fold protein [Vicinamibacterales bacterium]|nr:GSU2403 family nucleotidyltransferase fold protein [Vicinamibacterales bacterium]
MPTSHSDSDRFSLLVDTLRPWLGKVVFVGGWAHRLYRERPEAGAPPYDALRTEDADIALAPGMFARTADLRGRLIARGFFEEMSGDDQPPVTHYSLGVEELGFYVEFLTPLQGGERRRDGSRNVTERIGGVVAQKLRHLDVLLIAPWATTVSPDNGFAVSEAAVVLVPNPVSFIVQKLLIHSRRKHGDRAKDVLYVHDTIELFGGALDQLNEVWHVSVAPQLRPSVKREVAAHVTELFRTTTDAVRSASLIAAHRGLTPASIRELCVLGLTRLLR